MIDYKIYVGGQFLKTSHTLEIENPYTEKIFATTYQAGEEEVELAICRAQEVTETMKKLPSFTKYNILKQISEKLLAKKQYLAEILSQESGKPMIYARGEIERAAQTFLIAAEESKRLPSEMMSIDWTERGNNKEGFIKYFPIGIVAGIAPFNFPLNLAVHKIAPAIAAGCPIILKPSSTTPLSTLELAKIIDETDLPKGALSILPMNRITGNQLVTDPRFSLLSFTGSPDIGWKMKKDAGKKKVILELGGNAGVIVTPSGDINRALKQSLIGAFAYSGQVCIHVQRIFVQKDLYNNFLKRFTEGVQKLQTGDPLSEKTEISSMINEKNAQRIDDWVQEAVQQNAKIIIGGGKTGTFYEPTVITHTKKGMKIVDEEAFGPIVIIEPYNTFTDAIDMINDSKFGLQAGVFTKNMDEQYQAWNEIESGGVIINDMPTFRVDHMPYGGVKDSGLGREGVKYAIQDMMEPRIMIVDHS
ncbi:aldehyde dehydrogenase [Candidatus Peregrinibacteria bacterium]|nr:MAG: aldehyde dehydrogenase [Candidatus Peregrinibacteria bacterium]